MFNVYRVLFVMALILLLVAPSVAAAGNGEQKTARVITETVNPEVTYGPPLEGSLSSFTESFEGTTFPPAGWIKLNPDGGPGWNRQVNGTTPIPGWVGGTITVPPGGGNAVAFCTWNTGGATSNDQWLVTPQVMNVQANDSLKFYLRYWPNSYDDTLEIRISTSTPTIGNFTILVATLGFLGVGTTDTNWNQYRYRLSDFVTPGSNIYIAFRERVADNINDGASFSLDLVEVIRASPVPQVFTRRPNRSIPDNNLIGIRDTITTPAISNIVKVQVVLDTVLHTWVGDLTMNLTSPRGERIWLMFRPGPGTVGSSGDNFIGTVFDDTAARNIEMITSTGSPPLGPPYTGYFRPDSAGVINFLSVYNGNQPAGNWIIHVADNELEDLGTLVRWSIVIHTGTVGVEEIAGIPERFDLSQNYPNPFNPTTTIRYSLPRPEYVTIKVFDILGREVANLVDGFRQAGSYDVTWHADRYASGVYFYHMQAGSFSQTRKLVILK